MTSLKNNIKDLSQESEELIKGYVSLLTIKQSEKLSLLLGFIFSISIITMLILASIMFSSLALSQFLNTALFSTYAGYLIVSGIYIVIIILMILKITLSKTPFLANTLSRFIITIFDINISYSQNLSGLKREIEHLENKIDKSKIKIKADAQLLRYIVLESFIKEIFSLFKSTNKKTTKDKETTKDINLENEHE